MVKIRSVQNPLDWSFLEYLRSGKTRQKALPPAAEATRLPWVLEDWVSLHTARQCLPEAGGAGPARICGPQDTPPPSGGTSTGLIRCGWSAISLIKAGFSEF